jgi:cytochrome o ubiquinol oxidase subunit 3
MKHSSHNHVSLGVWVYLMSDCVLFACLFAAYAVLHTQTAAGPTAAMLFDRKFVFWETMALLTSSFTCGLALLAAHRKNARGVWTALFATFVLGLVFLGLELHEFSALAAAGHSWRESAFLSSFFTLVGTHGLHIFIGELWMLVLFAYLALRGLTEQVTQRILYFSLFWHFLDIVWICIFSFVYLFSFLHV